MKRAHSTVYHHLSQLSVDIQLTRLIKLSEGSGVQMQMTQAIFHSLDGMSPEATFLMQLTQMTSSSLDWDLS